LPFISSIENHFGQEGMKSFEAWQMQLLTALTVSGFTISTQPLHLRSKIYLWAEVIKKPKKEKHSKALLENGDQPVQKRPPAPLQLRRKKRNRLLREWVNKLEAILVTY